MVTRARGQLLRSIGYLAYTLGALALLLWLLFPEEALRRSLVGHLNGAWPELQWRLRSVTLEMPAVLRLEALEGYGAADRPMIRLDSLVVQPDWAGSLQSRRLRIKYQIVVGQGSIAGLVQSIAGPTEWSWEGTVQQLRLADWPLLSWRLGREVEGVVSATFAGAGVPMKQEKAQLKAEVKVENGRLGLKRPILSHSVIPFSLVSLNLRGDGNRVEIEQGEVASELMRGQFTGHAEWGQEATSAQIVVHGAVHPEPRFFKGLDNTVAVQAVRAQLKDKPLPFRLSGDPVNPSIHFEEFSMQFQALEKELR